MATEEPPFGEPHLLVLALLAYAQETGRDAARVKRAMERLSRADVDWLGADWQLPSSIKAGLAGNQKFFNDLVRNRALVRIMDVKSFPESIIPEELVPCSVRVRHILAAIVREWTSDAELERATCFGKISDFCRNYLPEDSSVLVPGASLARLAHEVAGLGHRVTAVEDDLLKSLVYKYMLSRPEISTEIFPYILNTCNRVEAGDHAAGLKFPDNPEILKSPVDFVSDDVFAWATELGDRKFDAIATSFFIDACDTPVVQLCRIFHVVVQPGGLWMNVGGLSYAYEGAPQRAGGVYEASAEEVLLAVRKTGWEVLEHGFVKTTYCANPRSLMRTDIDALFFVARRL